MASRSTRRPARLFASPRRRTRRCVGSSSSSGRFLPRVVGVATARVVLATKAPISSWDAPGLPLPALSMRRTGLHQGTVPMGSRMARALRTPQRISWQSAALARRRATFPSAVPCLPAMARTRLFQTRATVCALFVHICVFQVWYRVSLCVFLDVGNMRIVVISGSIDS